MKPTVTAKRDPVRIPGGVVYYERRKYVEVQLTNLFGMPVIGRIPWDALLESARRCRPEAFNLPVTNNKNTHVSK